MDSIDRILRHIPFFRHCTVKELGILRSLGKNVFIPGGQTFDLKKVSSFIIVVSGIFEIEDLGRNDIVYLAPGSFFGDIPFTVNRHRGKIKALVDSHLFLFETAGIYRFFLGSYKGMRGFLRLIQGMGFDLSDPGKKYAGLRCRVITSYSPYADSGKSLFAAYMGLHCAGSGKTIILDLSYSGSSVFNIFEKKITGALSQRSGEDVASEEFILERVENISDRLSVMNICFGSRVRVNPDILSPLLFILSKTFNYIVIDLSPQDEALRDRVMELSDTVFALIKKEKDRELLYDYFDANLKEGQRVFYTLNRHYTTKSGAFEGGFLFDDLELDRESSLAPQLLEYAGKGVSGETCGAAVKKTRAVVAETGFKDAVILTGLYSAMYGAGFEADILYSSALSYYPPALYVMSDDAEEYEAAIIKFFAEERLNSLLDITFPKEHVIGCHKALRFARELAGNHRAEMFGSIPMARLTGAGDGESRLFSTGYVKDLLAASFMLDPVGEPCPVGGQSFHSGYPLSTAGPEDLLRTDTAEVYYFSIKNRRKLEFSTSRVLNFFDRYLDFLSDWPAGDRFHEAATKHMVIEIDEDRFNVEKILEISGQTAIKYLKALV